MKVIFLDIDGVLNCGKTPDPRKLPYIVDKRLLARGRRFTRPNTHRFSGHRAPAP